MRAAPALAALLTLLLAACAAQPSPYRAFDGRYGFSERERGEQLEVRFAGNSVTPRETVESYALYRAAEATLERGYELFAVIGNEVEKVTSRYYTDYGPRPYWPYGPYYAHRYYYPYYYPRPHFPPSSSSETRYQAIVTVIPYSGRPPERAIRIEEAKAVIARLAPQVHPPAPAN